MSPILALAAAIKSPLASTLAIRSAKLRDSLRERLKTTKRSTMTTSERTDMIAKTKTMSRAKRPMWA